MRDVPSPDRPAATPATGLVRRHGLLPHTADAGLEAAAPTLPTLFEEAAAAFGELAADVAADAAPSRWEPVELVAGDLAGLAYGWLNELVALGEIHRAAIVATRVAAVEAPPGAPPADGWRLQGAVGLRPYRQGGVSSRAHVKSATYHGLAVERADGGWTLRAYLDI